jgi:hypothetical protein
MKSIPLSQGRFALVDDEDFEWLSRHTWHAAKVRNSEHIWYAATHVGKRGIRMHQMILGQIKGTVIHHEDHNGLNNQKNNLKRTTVGNNTAHQKKRSDNTSGYKGVCWDKKNQKWEVKVGDGPSRYSKRFVALEDAVTAYDVEATKRWGEFALTNKQLGLTVH